MSDADFITLLHEEDFLTLLQDELGLLLDTEALDAPFDELDAWDSVYLLKLLGALERATGRRVPLPDILRACTLRDVHEVVTA